MYAILYNLNSKKHGGKAVVYGPFMAMHTVALGEFRLIPEELDKDPVNITVDQQGMYMHGNERFYDMQIVSDIHNWGSYEIEEVGMPQD